MHMWNGGKKYMIPDIPDVLIVNFSILAVCLGAFWVIFSKVNIYD